MLTTREIETAKLPPKGGKAYKLHDKGKTPGLYLLVNSSGKYWRWDFTMNGKRRTLNIGPASKVSLSDARRAAEIARGQVRQGIDPVQERKRRRVESERQREAERLAKEQERNRRARTFGAAAHEWAAIQHWAPSYRPKVWNRIENYLMPKLGSLPVEDVRRNDLHDLIASIAKEKPDTARRVGQYANGILEWACNAGWLETNPMPRKLNLPAHQEQKQPAITDPCELGQLLRDIDDYTKERGYLTGLAMQLQSMTAVRSGELLQAEWSEIDWESRTWTIPAAHRKLPAKHKANPDNVHEVPLSRQAIALLERLHELTGHTGRLFHSSTAKRGTLTPEALEAAYHRMGYKDRHVPHGWRSSFATIMEARGYSKELLDVQLAHVERNRVRRAYFRSTRLEERRPIVQAWCDLLDALRSGAEVIPIRA